MTGFGLNYLVIDVVISDHTKNCFCNCVLFLAVFRDYRKYLFGCNYIFPCELHCYSFLYSVVDTDILCLFLFLL